MRNIEKWCDKGHFDTKAVGQDEGESIGVSPQWVPRLDWLKKEEGQPIACQADCGHDFIALASFSFEVYTDGKK